MKYLLLILVFTFMYQFFSNVVLTISKFKRNNIEISLVAAILIPAFVFYIHVLIAKDEIKSGNFHNAKVVAKMYILAYSLSLVTFVEFLKYKYEKDPSLFEETKKVSFFNKILNNVQNINFLKNSLIVNIA